MLSGVLAHLTAGVLASSSGLFALGWVLSSYDDPYGDFVMAAGRATAWGAVFYLILGLCLYGVAIRTKTSAGSPQRPASSWTGWLLQLAGATFALASSGFVAASAKRGPGGDFRALGYILLGLATAALVIGGLTQAWLWKSCRRDPQSPQEG
jgi:hypothetical protein